MYRMNRNGNGGELEPYTLQGRSAGLELGLCLPLLAHIRLVVEVEEHGEHEDVLDEADEGHKRRKLAGIPYNDQQEVEGEVAKLEQLQLRDLLLPPQDVLQGPQGGGVVVRVHHAVHQKVDHAQHSAVGAAQEGHEDGHAEDHAAVVVNVQEAHLRVLLA